MNAPARLRLDPDEYLHWEMAQERKHEFVGGEVRAMAGATRAHNEIAGNVYVELRTLLRGGPCRPYGSDMKVAIPNRNYRYPDVVIDCARGAPGDLFAAEPTVVFEVLSPSTEFFDETDKLADYQSIPSIRQIVLLSQQRPHARSFVRNGDGWRELRHDGVGADIPLFAHFQQKCSRGFVPENAPNQTLRASDPTKSGSDFVDDALGFDLTLPLARIYAGLEWG